MKQAMNFTPAKLKQISKDVDKASQSYPTRRKYNKNHPKQYKERLRHYRLWLASRIETRLYYYRQHIKKHGSMDKGTTKYINAMESQIHWLREGTQVRARIITGNDSQPTTMGLTKEEANDKDNSLHYAIEDSHQANEKESTNRIVESHAAGAANTRFIKDIGLQEINNIYRYRQEILARQSHTNGDSYVPYQPRLFWLGHELSYCLQIRRYYIKHPKSANQLKGYKLYIPVFHSNRHSARTTFKKFNDMDLSRLITWYLRHAKHTALSLEPIIYIGIKY